MSMAYDPQRPLCLFASEASALAVPVDVNGTWLSHQVDLDSHGEIMRIGEPRSLLEGAFRIGASASKITDHKQERRSVPMNGNELASTSSSKNSSTAAGVALCYSETSASNKEGMVFVSPLVPDSKRYSNDSFDQLNDRISVHEKFRVRKTSVYSLSSSIHSNMPLQSSIHGTAYGSNQVSSHGNTAGDCNTNS